MAALTAVNCKLSVHDSLGLGEDYYLARQRAPCVRKIDSSLVGLKSGGEIYFRSQNWPKYGSKHGKIEVTVRTVERGRTGFHWIHRLRIGSFKVSVGFQPRISRKVLKCTAAVDGDGSSKDRSVHFIGIGGSGLSALALLALQQGWKVSGSDATFNERLEKLKAAGARVYVGHAARHVVDTPNNSPPDAVVVSSSIPVNNVEVEAAQALGVPIYKRADWLGRITEGYELLAVAGSHGKSTTAAMLAIILTELGHNITAIVGAEVPQFPGGSNAICGRGQRFVLEADEYDGCFLGVAPSLAVVTNVEWEHVDFFPDETDKTKDSTGAITTTESQCDSDSRHVVTYGLGDGNDWQAVMLAPNVQSGTDYVVVNSGRPMARVTLQLPGTHNVLNSLAAIVVASLLASRDNSSSSIEGNFAAMKKAAEAASEALSGFVGIRRRFELVGKWKNCCIYDDYAHHPTEVRAVLQAARQRFDQQPIWVVFQPHTYSRLAKLLHDFAPAFSAADRVIITEVYSAREDNIWDISGADLAAVVTGPPSIFVSTLDKVVERLTWELVLSEAMGSKGVVLLTLGAGDITDVGYELLKALSTK
ncbi:hypothetical protein AXG93_3943s1060 [Marchantia polymorpha subsp. ruderalis]|uniref:UDP-N-acetylmuramate--L-alanine ligase n=1 Tax=Marchantia polymorpha subsp. ruderalis TaxID=1480154 RepID=A0A176WF23_MARPO|nr:hypothetical protein AXG93_3943s1060 [Marchantia polymorpha subsp. ruderalis]